MLDIANNILERAVGLSENYGIEEPIDLFEKVIGQEFEPVQEGQGIKILDLNSEHVDDGVFIYFTKTTKLVFTEKFSTKSYSISEEDAVELMALSYIARQLSILKRPCKNEMQEITAKMDAIIKNYI